jgi:hypothetical protein
VEEGTGQDDAQRVERQQDEERVRREAVQAAQVRAAPDARFEELDRAMRRLRGRAVIEEVAVSTSSDVKASPPRQ